MPTVCSQIQITEKTKKYKKSNYRYIENACTSTCIIRIFKCSQILYNADNNDIPIEIKLKRTDV